MSNKKSAVRRAGGTRGARRNFDAERQRQTGNRLAFAWHGLAGGAGCDGTVWIHLDGACECTQPGCLNPFKAFHPAAARRPCRSDSPVAKACPRCAPVSRAAPPAVNPLSWVTMANDLLAGTDERLARIAASLAAAGASGQSPAAGDL